MLAAMLSGWLDNAIIEKNNFVLLLPFYWFKLFSRTNYKINWRTRIYGRIGRSQSFIKINTIEISGCLLAFILLERWNKFFEFRKKKKKLKEVLSI